MNGQPPSPPQAPGPPKPPSQQPGDLPTPPLGPTKQKSGKLKWVLLAVGIIVVIVIIAVVVSAGKKTSTNKTTTTSSAKTAGTAKSTSPGAASSTGQTTGANQTTYSVPTEAQIGIPFYPGAVVNTERSIKDHSANVTDYVDLEVAGQTIDAVTNWYQTQLASKPNYVSSPASSQGTMSTLTYDEGGYEKMVTIYDFSQTPDSTNPTFKGIEVDLSRWPLSGSSTK